jgi:hypothetical protein
MRSHSTALLAACALSALVACSAPPDREARPAARRAARSEPAESREEPQPAPRDDRLTEEALGAAQTALRAADELDAREKQRQTVRDERSIGAAIIGWISDSLDHGGTAGQPAVRKATVDVRDYSPISQEQLERLLVPRYIARLPAVDGWGHPYEVRLNTQNLASERAYMIRSPGRDGMFSTDSYTPGAFDSKDYDEDIVFADNFLVRWPD